MYLNNPVAIQCEELPDNSEDTMRINKRNREVLYDIESLLKLKDFEWSFKDADHYRRRPFPIQFLQNECSPYPCYVF